MKLWGGRFTKPTNELVDEYTASISFDQKLATYDILGSLAHVNMLASAGIIEADERDTIVDGLKKVDALIKSNKDVLTKENEDIHMNVEKLLIDEIGPVGGKLHTGRSRNDQIALDMRLYLRDQVVTLVELLTTLQTALLNQAKAHTDTILPVF